MSMKLILKFEIDTLLSPISPKAKEIHKDFLRRRFNIGKNQLCVLGFWH